MKTVTKQLTLLLLLLFLAVFTVACEKTIPEAPVDEPVEQPWEEEFTRDIIEDRDPYDGAWFSSVSPVMLWRESPNQIPYIIEKILTQEQHPSTAAREVLREEWATFRVPAEDNASLDIYLAENVKTGNESMELYLTFTEDGAVKSAAWVEARGLPARPTKIAWMPAEERLDSIARALEYEGIEPQDARSYIRTRWEAVYERSYGKRDFYISDICDCEEAHKEYLVLIFDENDILIEIKVVDET